MARPCLASLCLGFGILAASAFWRSAAADGERRSLSMVHTHTGERLNLVYKQDGRYLPDALRQINWFLRDWRQSQSTDMDPRMLDLLAEVQQDLRAPSPIYIICGYRNEQTNAMLHTRSSGVAERSQHMLGRAIDFFIPGVPLSRLREIGMVKQQGGVGFYPTSGSPFVHLDVGNVRAWPRMTTQQLARLFPDGETLHVPSDGPPLPGYQLALARQRDGHSRRDETVLAFAERAVEAGAPLRAEPPRPVVALLSLPSQSPAPQPLARPAGLPGPPPLPVAQLASHMAVPPQPVARPEPLRLAVLELPAPPAPQPAAHPVDRFAAVGAGAPFPGVEPGESRLRAPAYVLASVAATRSAYNQFSSPNFAAAETPRSLVQAAAPGFGPRRAKAIGVFNPQRFKLALALPH